MQFFPEYNIFLKIGGLQIHMYAVCIIIGAFIAYLLGQYNFKKLGYSSEILSDYFFGVLMTGIIGARIWYVIFMWKELYASHPEERDILLFKEVIAINECGYDSTLYRKSTMPYRNNFFRMRCIEFFMNQ